MFSGSIECWRNEGARLMSIKILWLEIWVEYVTFRHVLFLRALSDGTFDITTPSWPSEAQRQARFTSYEDAVHWLREDEYEIVEGRVDVAWGRSDATETW
jgi:hypothetical protein